MNKIEKEFISRFNITEFSRIKQINTPSTVLICKNIANVKFVIKYAEQEGAKKICEEYGWYTCIEKMFEFTPKVKDFMRTSLFTALMMEYVKDPKTIDEMVVKCPGCNITELIDKSILCLHLLFEYGDTYLFSFDDAVKQSFSRFNSRLKIAKKFGYLNNLYRKSEIVINGRNYKNYNYYMDLVNARNLLEYLTPVKYGLIHGDLHCGNVLVNDKSNIYLIDPNGSFKLPLEYDIGKILHSIHGGFGIIQSGMFSLIKLNNNSFVFDVNIPECYKNEYQRLKKTLNNDLFIRSLYAEAMHYACMPANHAENENEATALYLRGIQLFDEFIKYI